MTAEAPTTGSPDEAADAGALDREAQRVESERFRLLVENSRDLIIEVSPRGEVLYVSPNVTTVLGFAPTELLGESVFSHVHPDDTRHVMEQFALRSGRATARHQHKDSTWRWLETSGREFTTPHGALHRVLIARDVTAETIALADRERLETELVRMEKLNALGTLAGGIAHDFNNLLTGVVAYAHVARLDSRQPEVNESLDQLLKATDRARDLAQQILTFWRQQRQPRRPLQLRPIVQEVFALLRVTTPRTIEFVSEFPGDAGWVLADNTQIHQVVLNLCSNAVQAISSRAGRLEVRVSHLTAAPDADDALAHAGANGFTSLEVTDTGHGMDAATQRRIFEPFFSTKLPAGGTGVGLAVVQRIVRDHSGTIHVTSEPGKGTTFRILLPACPAPAPVKPA